MEPALGSATAQRARSRRSPLALASAIALGLAALIGLVAIALRFGVRPWVIRAARERGVALEPGTVEAHVGRVIVHDAHFGLVGVRGFDARAATIAIELDGFAPRRVTLDRVAVTLVGREPLEDVPAWLEVHAAATPASSASLVATSATEASVAWSPEESSPAGPFVELVDAAIDPVAAQGVVQHAHLRALGRDVGDVELAYAWNRDGLRIGVSGDRPEVAPAHVVVTSIATGVGIDARLDPAGEAAASALLSAALSTRPLGVSAKASLAVPIPRATANGAALTGEISGEITGWVPPHPPELDGIVFGNRTSIATSIRVDEHGSRIDLPDVRMTAGALALRGEGALASAEPPQLTLHLHGAIACSELARSAALARLGPKLGAFAGRLATDALTGTVLVRVDVSGDPRHLDRAHIEREAMLGCSARLLEPTR